MKIFDQVKLGASSNLVDANLRTTETVMALGAATVNDGGGAMYYIVGPRAADEVEDFTLPNGNVAEFLHSLGTGGAGPQGLIVEYHATEAAALAASQIDGGAGLHVAPD